MTFGRESVKETRLYICFPAFFGAQGDNKV